MSAPFSPQGEQKQYTERPLKVYAEQYQTGHPIPIGAVVDPIVAGLPLYSDGQPRVLLPAGYVVVALGAWVISNRYTGAPIEVLSNEEFTERYGGSGAETG
jgi:hypothetical protein